MISIPRLSFQDIANYYSIIRVTHMGIASPLDVIDVTSSKDWEAPEHPTEQAIFIHDTIYEQPREVNINCYVRASMLPIFEAQIKLSVKLGMGFTLFTMGGVYSNMFVTSLTRPEKAETNNGYQMAITFTEVRQVGSLIGQLVNLAFNLGATATATAINTINQGTMQPYYDSHLEVSDTALQFGMSFL